MNSKTFVDALNQNHGDLSRLLDPDSHGVYFSDGQGDQYRAMWSPNDGWLIAIRVGKGDWVAAEDGFDSTLLTEFGPYTFGVNEWENAREQLQNLERGWRDELQNTVTYNPNETITLTFDKPFDAGYGVATTDSMSEFEGGGKRSSDEGKPKFEYLLAPDMPYDEQILARIANRMEEGAKHYGDNNYGLMNTEDALKRCRSSLLRHTLQYINGETDEDHLAAIGCNILMVSKIEHNLKGKSDA